MVSFKPNIELEPSEMLIFREQFGTTSGVGLVIKNLNNEEVYFKIKCTALKFYHVRPNIGIIKKFSEVKIRIQPIDKTLRSIDEIRANHHRFLVQCVYLREGKMLRPKNFWTNLKKDGSVVNVRNAKLQTKVISTLVASTSKNNIIEQASRGNMVHAETSESIDKVNESYGNFIVTVLNNMSKIQAKVLMRDITDVLMKYIDNDD